MAKFLRNDSGTQSGSLGFAVTRQMVSVEGQARSEDTQEGRANEGDGEIERRQFGQHGLLGTIRNLQFQ
jgi:hypothetical protein